MTIDVLPTEILVKILCKVKKCDHLSDTKDFTSALTVSRRWSECASSAIWRDVVLTSAISIDRFSGALSSLTATRVQCLVIMITAEPTHPDDEYVRILDQKYPRVPWASAATKALSASLAQLADSLPDLSSLRSFSLSVRTQHGESRPFGFLLDRKDLSSILRQLPSSLEDLELDTAGTERAASDADACHLCADIQKLLLRLRHVRLRLGMICRAMFPITDIGSGCEGIDAQSTEPVAVPPKLTSLLINLHQLQDPSLCPKDDAQPPPMPPQRPTWLEQVPPDARAHIAQIAQTALTLDKFPALVEARIIDGVLGEPGFCPAIVDKHMMDNISYVSPHSPVAGDGTQMLRLRDAAGQDHEHFGYGKFLALRVEGPSWVETTEGFRFSRSFSETAVAKERGYVYKDIEMYEGREEFLKRHRAKPEFWFREKKHGRWLINPAVVDGVGVVKGGEIEPPLRDSEAHDSDEEDYFEDENDE